MRKTIVSTAVAVLCCGSALAACPTGTVPPTANGTALACEVGTVRFIAANENFAWKFEIVESGNRYVIADDSSLIPAASDGSSRAVVSQGTFVDGNGAVLHNVVRIRTPF